MIPDLTAKEVERFQRKILHGDGCWLWQGETNNKGYGYFAIYRSGKRVRILAHRLAYKLATGHDPDGSVVRHSCDNPPCCNPAELRPGTQRDNMRDAVERGRISVEGLDAYRIAQSLAAVVLSSQGKRRCNQCELILPITEFHRNRTKPSGRSDRCKTCWSLYQNLRRGGMSEDERRALKRRNARTRARSSA